MYIKKYIFRWVGFSISYSLLAQISSYYRDAWSFSATTWLPAALLFVIFWRSPLRNWPLWQITATGLHVLVGLYNGRPLLLASLFATIDLLFPLGVLIFRYAQRLIPGEMFRAPVADVLTRITLLMVCTCGGSALFSLCLLLAGYQISPLHSISWAKSALTGILAVLPFLYNSGAPFALRWKKPSWSPGVLVILLNLLLLIVIYFTPVGHQWSNFNPILLHSSVLYLSLFALSSRQTGLLLLAQYLVITIATQQRSGLFFHEYFSIVPAMWHAQWYLIFSAIVANGINAFLFYSRQQQTLSASEQHLIEQFSQTGGMRMFTLIMPTGELQWRCTAGDVLPTEIDAIHTLELLEAHCDSPFSGAFSAWYHNASEDLFRQPITLHALHGEPIRYLLLIQRHTETNRLDGGILRLH